VAVPDVVAYNQFAARIKVFASAIDDFGRELLNSLEEIHVRPGAAVPAPSQMTSRDLQGRDLSHEVERGLYK
jgi:biopolymer transport protein TolQ